MTCVRMYVRTHLKQEQGMVTFFQGGGEGQQLALNHSENSQTYNSQQTSLLAYKNV